MYIKYASYIIYTVGDSNSLKVHHKNIEKKTYHPYSNLHFFLKKL